ncbi:undecaprenyl/decaprenyl-phosphate alpha-N-acetylglucosaminyl 1-phosphate transferase, partial [Streptomyces roseolus]
GLVLLLMPRFSPRAPRWAEAIVPPRYRRRSRVVEPEPEHGAAAEEDRVPVPAGLHGSTAIGHRSRFSDRRKAGTPS